MMDLNMRKPTLNMTIHSRPSQPALLASSLERSEPEASDLISEAAECFLVRRYSVITEVPADHRSQPLALVGHWSGIG